MTTIDPQVLDLGGEPDAAAFPPAVRFGAATASYQIEGAVDEDGRGESIWDRFCATPGAVANGDTGDAACDHYHRWEADLDLMAELGLESYRFSIAWPRVQPDGPRAAPTRRGLGVLPPAGRGAARARDRADRDALPLGSAAGAAGRRRLGGARHRGALRRVRGADGRRAGRRRVAAGSPTTSRGSSPSSATPTGTKAPGIRHWPTALRASHHLLLSHGLALRALRAQLGDLAQVGIALNQYPIQPRGPSDADRDAARRMDGHLNRWFLDPVLRGRYPADMLELYEGLYGPLGVRPRRRPGR